MLIRSSGSTDRPCRRADIGHLQSGDQSLAPAPPPTGLCRVGDAISEAEGNSGASARAAAGAEGGQRPTTVARSWPLSIPGGSQTHGPPMTLRSQLNKDGSDAHGEWHDRAEVFEGPHQGRGSMLVPVPALVAEDRTPRSRWPAAVRLPGPLPDQDHRTGSAGRRPPPAPPEHRRRSPGQSRGSHGQPTAGPLACPPPEHRRDPAADHRPLPPATGPSRPPLPGRAADQLGPLGAANL